MQNGTAVHAEDNGQSSVTEKVKNENPTIRVPSPAWLPKDWITVIRFRQSGSSKGLKDKYYDHIPTGTRCRSKPEVLSFIATGKKKMQNVKRMKQHSDSDGMARQTQGQEDSENQNARKGNARKIPIKVLPLTVKALDNGLISSTPASQGQSADPQQNDKKLSKMDGTVSTGEAVSPPGIIVPHISGKGPENTGPKPPETGSRASNVHKKLSKIDGTVSTGEAVLPRKISFTPISDKGPENTGPKPSQTGSRASKVKCTEQSMASVVSAQAGCHGSLNSHNQPCYPVMPLGNGLLGHDYCCTNFGRLLTPVPFSDPPRSPRSVLYHNSDISNSDLQVQHRPPKGRRKGSKNVGVNPKEMKRRLAELGRSLIKQSLGIGPSPSTAKLESETTCSYFVDGMARQTQGQEDSENQNARKGNGLKIRIKVPPLTVKALNNGLTSSTPASQGQSADAQQNEMV